MVFCEQFADRWSHQVVGDARNSETLQSRETLRKYQLLSTWLPTGKS